MSNIQFGVGSLYGFVPGTTTPVTPVQFGALQDVELDFSPSVKELMGQYQFPIAVGRGVSKVTGKAKFADINSHALATLHFNETPVTGQTITINNEAGTISADPFTVQVTNHTTFVDDYGVLNALTGVPYVKVATSATPTTGQYKVTSGTYTFASADTTLTVKISYSYTLAGGYTMTLNNQVLGVAPVFQVNLQKVYNLKYYSCTLYQCMSSKLTLPFKLEDFTIAEFDFSAFVNSANVLGIMSFPE